MSAIHVKYLLVGGGLASSAAAQAIRQRDPRGELMMVGLEKLRPYHRPPLSTDYLARGARDGLFGLPINWFADHAVQLRTGVRASTLDTARRVVTLESGQEISFDKLLLATGASPVQLRVPGSTYPNVYYLRTTDDADRLRHGIEQAKREGLKHDRAGKPGRGRAAVIGAGLLGVELAGTLTQMGLGVDLIASTSHPWSRFAGEQTGKLLTRHLEKAGVRVMVNAIPARLEGDGRVQRVVVDTGESVACDFAVVAIGVMANRELLRGTPITAEKAILVDDHFRTNTEGIYAAGDCAAVFDPLFGKHRVLDHFDSATTTGAIAGANMAGANERYATVSRFETEVLNLSVKGWGEPKQVDHRLIRGTTTADAPDFVEIGIASDGRIAQVLSVNHEGEDSLLEELVARRVNVEGKEEALKDPSVPLAIML